MSNYFFVLNPSLGYDETNRYCFGLFPHNSGTTLIEHLYMGNPFIAYSNRPSVGRIGASILTALGREEWIANSEQEYVDKVVALAKKYRKTKYYSKLFKKSMTSYYGS